MLWKFPGEGKDTLIIEKKFLVLRLSIRTRSEKDFHSVLTFFVGKKNAFSKTSSFNRAWNFII